MPKALTEEAERNRRLKISNTLKKGIKDGSIINAFSKGEKHTRYYLGQHFSEKHKENISTGTILGMHKSESWNNFLLAMKKRRGISLTDKHKEKQSISMKKWHNDPKNSEKITNKNKNISIAVKLSFIKYPYLREISRKTLTNLNKNPDFRAKSLHAIKNIHPNHPEKLVLSIIKENNLPFKYVGNHSFWITEGNNNFNPDFIDTENKKIIEVFGIYWHNYPDGNNTDDIRLETYKNKGYKCLVIWDNEPVDIIRNKILNFSNE